ncbi:MAG: hypothetical protein BGO09_07470 [Bacteroidetes bacterium 47-18]|nr:MAG: hypothetical protein BGO09_07470 [Bacteroidetes bacterium 47-18]
MTKKSILLSLAVAGWSLSLQAQTVSDFELSLPSSDTSYLETLSADGQYPFTSGNVTLTGNIQYGGTYRTWFNYSNRTDSTTESWTNMWSAFPAMGYNSSTYAIAYLEADYPNNPNRTHEHGAQLLGAARGHHIIGAYFTTTTYANLYIKEYYQQGDYLKLTVKGYNNNQPTNTVEITLADYTASGLEILNNWTWVDLMDLGAVDSITFQMTSTDDYTPFYFAMDNFTTSDGVCPAVTAFAASETSGNKAMLTWQGSNTSMISRYEVAVDQSNTNEPASSTVTYPVALTEFEAVDLTPNTDYVAHIRTVCVEGASEWQKLNFNSGALGIRAIATLDINIYPNPSGGLVHIQYPASKISSIELLSIDGKSIMQQSFTNQIDLSGLGNGNYILKLRDTDGNVAQKIISKL